MSNTAQDPTILVLTGPGRHSGVTPGLKHRGNSGEQIQGARMDRKSPAPSAAGVALKLLPLMIVMLILVTVAFLILSFVEANAVRNDSRLSTTRAGVGLGDAQLQRNPETVAEHQDCARWQLLALLEAHTIQQRYHQANVALILRGSIKYLGFLTGMILSIVGAVFILAD
jgi:hypothetical protein